MPNKKLVKSVPFFLVFAFITISAQADQANENVISVSKSHIDSLWVLMAAALVFLMQAGFKSLEVGL
jgi:hypothetical protein